MKKEIIALLNSTEGTLKLTPAATLYRWTRDAIGEQCDGLRVNITAAPGYHSKDYTITAREWSEVIEEAAEAVRAYYAEVSASIAAEILNGHF